MSSRERRILHLVLKQYDDLKTDPAAKARAAAWFSIPATTTCRRKSASAAASDRRGGRGGLGNDRGGGGRGGFDRRTWRKRSRWKPRRLRRQSPLNVFVILKRQRRISRSSFCGATLPTILNMAKTPSSPSQRRPAGAASALCASPGRTRRASLRRCCGCVIRLAAGHARFGELIDAYGEKLDEIVATLFAAPNSYTGEDVLEIAAHGAPVILEASCNSASPHGARLAESRRIHRARVSLRPHRSHAG